MVPELKTADIFEQLDKIETSLTFLNVPKQRQLLHYLVRQTLAGHREELKGACIANELFGGEEGEMRSAVGRLRNKVRDYYESEGRSDSIRIVIPKGRYIATFASTVGHVEMARDELSGLFRTDGTNVEAPSPETGIVGVEKVVSAGGKDDSDDYLTNNSRFILSLDGIVLNSVGELIFGLVSNDVIAECHSSYERALEDFAFALVYGSELRAKWERRDPRLFPKDQKPEPAELLIWTLREAPYRHETLNPAFHSTQIFANEVDRDAIRKYIHYMGSCMRQRRFLEWCRDWLKRESAVYLGTDETLFKKAKDPSEFRFGKDYYRNDLLKEIPALLEDCALATLVSFVPEFPGEERRTKNAQRYRKDARVRFVLENVLTHITTMYQFEKHAAHFKLWRVPYGLRAEVTRELCKGQSQERLRSILLGHALDYALRMVSLSDNRTAVVQTLLAMRKLRPFNEIREMLDHLRLISWKNEDDTGRKAERFIQEICRAGREGQPGPIDRFWALHSSVLRELAKSEPDNYRKRLYKIFPELNPWVAPGRKILPIAATIKPIRGF